MCKSREKKYNKYNATVVKALSQKFDMTPEYIRKCVSNGAHSEASDVIRAEYKDLTKKLEVEQSKILQTINTNPLTVKGNLKHY